MEKPFDDRRFQLALLVVLALLLVYLFPSDGEIPEVPVDEESYVEVEVLLQNQNLRLLHDCLALDMGISPEQARSIEHGIHGELWERPGSHDLIKDILEGYDVNVVMARVRDIQNGAYIADLFLEKEGTVYRLDSRPSDAVAIALRTEAPIEVHEDLLHEHGRNVC